MVDTLDGAMRAYLAQPAPDAGMWVQPITYGEALRRYNEVMAQYRAVPTPNARRACKRALELVNAVAGLRKKA